MLMLRDTMSPRIQAIVNQFVNDLTEAIQDEGAAAFKAAIAADGFSASATRALRDSPGPKPSAQRRGKGEKRAPAEIAALTKNLLAAIKKTPGQRIEQIGKAMNVPTKELTLPIAKLWDAKSIRTTGQRRATKYFAR